MGTSSYVELKSLSKRFAGRAAVEAFELRVERGELVSLLGPSGCGKTTTLRMVAGFETPDAGEVWVGGEDMLAVPSHRRGMGIVFQNYALFPHLTAWGNVAFGLKVAGQPSERVRRRVPELLELVGLQDAARKYPRELSGGQQQRIALARALAIEPRLLLLDEPLSALDAVVRQALREEIRRIQSALGVTTLYVTHDQEEALAISDRVVVMREGRIEQVGPPGAIYAEPATRFVAGFIGKMNQLPGVVEDAVRGHVRWGAHRLAVPAAALGRLASGARVVVLVRPEAIAIVPAAAPAPADGNRVRARVELVTFLGSVNRVSLDAAGHRILADVGTAVRVELARGAWLDLEFPAEACRVIPDAGADVRPAPGATPCT